ncbi:MULTISPECIES: GlmU family protein [Leptospira]|uniref:Glucose-1-phosphate thymidylyltransferase n=1 Tax=Leptospira kirschneri serovar Pomona TaxID=561005 RepID=A0A1T1E116_9LEPT|nr:MULTISPECIES: GlmU family protein [Leptospira]EMJ95289.1 putative UDP-N-acetylglucosamine diphosphorylase/glucosamine-1-phosphate N-acetyltransferase [Leptospira kirschneri str. JB]EMK05968.1 putative UDP-N-acetylglucosamine diphosphorylase/glucosamine-1-phosphate N-acetyltransferase [Leptospira kirschneri]KXZ28931.1 glucose-1-phosphate thymidylyltransferase [Leptospira kirschneri]KXZ33621.1 glucose-1-phosphate thymidylyltransferase [Leptospira sp. ZV016]OOV46778.1 glucose-1-phosphate thymi
MPKVQRILIDEREVPAGLRSLTRIRSFSEIRNGILNTIQRTKEIYQDAKIFYAHSNITFQQAFLERNPKLLPYDEKDVDLVLSPESCLPWNLIDGIAKNIEADLELSKDVRKWIRKIKVKSNHFHVVGKSKHLHVHPSATVYPGVVFDTTSGPVIVDKDVKITSFSFIEGPVYIGPNSHIDNVRITGATSIGATCRIGGEVGTCLIGDFTNKHHEGFLGHSILGSWVNIGALATTSDLKNNYGVVKIREEQDECITGSIKFGSVIGDYCKIAIGVMLNTGTVIDFGSNVVSSRIGGYISPFTWAESGQPYILDLFLRDARKIMARRNKELTLSETELIRILYESKVKK